MNTNIKDFSIKFEGSPEKYGKYTYYDLQYMQSKLSDNVLYKDLCRFKQTCIYKMDVAADVALHSLHQNKYSNLQLQKDILVNSLTSELNTLRRINNQLLNRNIQRVNRILLTHQQNIKMILGQKEMEIKLIQSQTELLSNRIEQLERLLGENDQLMSNVDKQKQKILVKQYQLKQEMEQFTQKMKKDQLQFKQKQKYYINKINQLHDQKLEIQLYFKRIMLEGIQNKKQELQEKDKLYNKKLEQLELKIIDESVKSKQKLNKVLRRQDESDKQKKEIIKDLQDKIFKLQTQNTEYKCQNAQLNKDITDMQINMDKYRVYLQQSEHSIRKLKELLLQSQQQLEKAKIQLSKGYLQRDSVLQRIRICEQQARMWQESYYLNKSRAAYNDWNEQG